MQNTSEECSVFHFKYRISREDFLAYGVASAGTALKEKRRQRIITGVVEVFVGLVFVIFSFVTQIRNMVTRIGATVFLFMGVYTTVLYSYFFPKLVQKSVLQQYEKSLYLAGDIEISLFKEHLEEKSTTYNGKYNYYNILAVTRVPSGFAINVDEKRTVLIPFAEVEDEDEFEKFLKNICNKYEKPFLIL